MLIIAVNAKCRSLEKPLALLKLGTVSKTMAYY